MLVSLLASSAKSASSWMTKRGRVRVQGGGRALDEPGGSGGGGDDMAGLRHRTWVQWACLLHGCRVVLVDVGVGGEWKEVELAVGGMTREIEGKKIELFVQTNRVISIITRLDLLDTFGPVLLVGAARDG